MIHFRVLWTEQTVFTELGKANQNLCVHLSTFGGELSVLLPNVLWFFLMHGKAPGCRSIVVLCAPQSIYGPLKIQQAGLDGLSVLI